ncbi:hypothetical protein BGW42_007285 [Actinomortierella wolfii]|nr:hypothetical protein BGW42_007285 [Actinomortierella wolfii]
MARRTSFTLSPTSSNPELGHSQTDSHSGDSLMAAHLVGRGHGQDYRHQDSQLGSSYDSNRYNRDGAQHQPRRRDSPSYSSASSPPTHLHRLHPSHHHEDHTRFLFPGRDTDQQSIGEEDIEEEMPHYDHPARHHNSQQKQHHHFRDPSHHSRYESSINDDMDDPFRPRHRPSVPHHHHHHHHHRASASEASAYPLSTSSRSIEESHDEHAPGLRRHHQHRHHQGETEDEEMDHDDDDATTSSAAAARMADDEQLRAETEYIMSRNAELLKILAIRDDEIQTLQQELDHTLKIMHEYENDLMEMHTAAAQPYESYHQTLDEIGREMTQQDALLKGYKEENEKLASQCRSLIKIRNETEKRHLEKVETLQTEIERLQKLLDEARQKLQQYQRSQPSPSPNEGSVSQTDIADNSQDLPETHGDLRAALTRLEALRERERVSYLNKEEGYLAEIAMLKDRVAMLEKILEDEKRHKVEDIQRLERDFQDVRDGYDDMVEQIKSLGVSSVPLPPTTGEVPTKTATYTVSERPLLLHRESSSDETSSMTSGKHNGRKVGGSTTPISGIHSRGSASSSSLHQKTSPDETTTTTAKPSSARSQRGPDRKLTSTETLTTSNMPKVMAELGLDQRISRFEADIRQSLMRSSSMDSFASVQSSSNNSNGAAATATIGITSMAPTTATTAVSSSGHPLGSTAVGTTGSTVSTAPTSTGPSTTSTSSSSLAAVSHQASGEQLRPTSVAESQALANKLRDRINVLNAENQRLHQELATLSQAMRQQQAERQRKVKQLEDLLDLHESVAEKKLMEDRTMAAAAPTTPTTTSDPNAGSQGGEEKSKKDPSSDPSTVEGQQRIRKIIQGLLVRIRTKEAEAEFYHNAYLDKVLELDQLALKTSNKGLFFSPLQGPLTPSAATATAGDPMAAGAGTPVSPLPPSSADQTALAQQQQQQQQQQIQLQQQQQTIAALENRVMELEQANLELTIRLQVEQRRAQARESENTALTREKLVLARLLEDQIEELKAKLANTEVAHQKLLEENATLRERGAKDAAAAAAAAKAAAATKPKNDAQDEELAILRSRMSSLTRQRDQLREQLQEALDIQLKMTHDSGVAGAGSGPGAAVLKSGTGASSAAGAAGTRNEWTVEDYKRLERALEEKTTELCLWKERAIALEKVVERIRMIKVKPDVFGSASTTSSISDAAVHGEQRRGERTSGHESESSASVASASSSTSNIDHSRKRRSQGGGSSSKHGLSRSQHQRPPLSHTLEELDQIVLKLEQRLERRDQELREVVLEAKRQTDMRLEQWKAKWVQVVQRKNAEIRRFQIELESLMKAVDRDRQRMMARQQQKDGASSSNDNHASSNGGAGSATGPGVVGGSKLRSGNGLGPGMHLSSHQDDYDDDHDLVV